MAKLTTEILLAAMAKVSTWKTPPVDDVDKFVAAVMDGATVLAHPDDVAEAARLLSVKVQSSKHLKRGTWTAIDLRSFAEPRKPDK